MRFLFFLMMFAILTDGVHAGGNSKEPGKKKPRDVDSYYKFPSRAWGCWEDCPAHDEHDCDGSGEGKCGGKFEGFENLKRKHKVWICHATGGNKWVPIEVDYHAKEAHKNHHDGRDEIYYPGDHVYGGHLDCGCNYVPDCPYGFESHKGVCQCPHGFIEHHDQCLCDHTREHIHNQCQCKEGLKEDRDGNCGCPHGQDYFNGGCHCKPNMIKHEHGCECKPGYHWSDEHGKCTCKFDYGYVEENDACVCPIGHIRTEDGKCVCPKDHVFDRYHGCRPLCHDGEVLFKGKCLPPPKHFNVLGWQSEHDKWSSSSSHDDWWTTTTHTPTDAPTDAPWDKWTTTTHAPIDPPIDAPTDAPWDKWTTTTHAPTNAPTDAPWDKWSS